MSTELAIEYGVIAGYLVFLIAIGVAFTKFNANISDYFRNGCRGTWWLVGSSAFMQMFSAWTFTGAAGAAFEAGWSVMVIFAANVFVFFLIFLFLGPWFRQLRAITAPEVIRERFGTGTQQAYAWLQGLLGVLYAAVWLWGLATFAASVFDFTGISSALGLAEIEFVIILTGLIVLIYSVAGGSWAVMATDFVQSLILIPLTILVAFLCLQYIGGVDNMFAQIEEQGLSETFKLINDPDDFPLGKYGLMFAIATVMYKTIAYSTLVTAQKYFGVKDGNEARKAGLLACLLMLGGMMIWFIPPVVAKLTMADEVLAGNLPKPAEGAYALIAVKLLPTGLTGLIVVAMLAATMSSMDSGLNRNAGIYIRDIDPIIRKTFGWPDLSDRGRLLLSRIVSTILGCIIISLALYFAGGESQGVFEYMLNIGALVALPMAVPMMLALFVKTVPSWSALVSIGCGLIPSTLGFFSGNEAVAGLFEGTFLSFFHEVLDEKWSYAQKVFTGVSVSAVAFLGTAAFWHTASAAYRSQVARFFTRMHTPVDFEKEVGASSDAAQLKIIGLFCLLIGGFISLLLFVPANDWADRGGIFFVAGFVASIGLLLRFAGVQQDRKERRERLNEANAQQDPAMEPDTDPNIGTGTRPHGDSQ